MQRRVDFGGVTNFRDLGGYETDDGRRVRWGRVFRSDGLHGLSGKDLEVFDALGVSAIYDLRRPEEIEHFPGPRPHIHLELPSTRVADTPPERLRSKLDGERWLADDYRAMLRDSPLVFGRLFSLLASEDRLPAVFHCFGGKDRTGMVAALLLGCLGVPREEVLYDYELTATYRSAEHVPELVELFLTYGISEAAARAMLSTCRWGMVEALGALDEDFGGIDAYLLGPCQLSEATLSDLRGVLLE